MDDSHYTAFPNGTTRPRVHVIGNGASNSLFDIENEYRCVCNIPQHNIPYNSIAIIDLIVVNWMNDNGWNPSVPVLTTNKVKQHAIKRNRQGHWFDVFEIKSRYSAGHHAVEYHAPMTDEVHMWGFDSIWTNDYTSQMDNLVPRGKRPNLNQQWIPHWQNIFDANKNTQFIIHTPVEVVLPDISTNVTHISH
jgi:hypothetical protein